MPVSLSLLNHASILVEDSASNVRLLADPWFSGFAFDEGWGLRYANEQAMEHAARATHLWISHFHDDHMHIPTLKELHKRNPGIVFLANASYNFNIAAVARRIGFQNVIELPERTELQIADSFSVMRFPATGIDNMLLMKIGDVRVLNYNDCNLSSFAQRALAKKMGRVDILLSNFNHAGKLLHTKPIPDAVIRRKLVDNFSSNYTHFKPALVVPFASHHYYRAPESFTQNSSMIGAADLLALDARIVDLEVGDSLEYTPGSPHRLIRGTRQPAVMTTIERKTSRSLEDLVTAGQAYSTKLRKGYGVVTWLLPSLLIALTDLAITVRFDPARGLSVANDVAKERAQLSCHSAALNNWFTKTYGTDAFAVGAHFRLGSGSRFRLVLMIAAGMLVENRLDLKSLLASVFKRDGRRFLFNRREEILGILLSGKIFADYHSE